MIDQQRISCHPGSMHNAVDPAKLSQNLRDGTVNLVGLRYVGLDVGVLVKLKSAPTHQHHLGVVVAA